MAIPRSESTAEIIRKLDSRLSFRMADRTELDDPSERVVVLVHTDDLAAAEAAGLWTDWTAGPVARGTVAYRDLAALAALDSVIQVDEPKTGRLLIHDSVPEIRADKARKIPPGFSGKNVIVGVVDTGVDIFHFAFRKDDGSTRIVSLLDQTIEHHFEMTGKPTADSTFTLRFTGPAPKEGAARPFQITGPIKVTSTAAEFQAVLEALDIINPGDVTVAGGPLGSQPIVVDFVGRYDPRVVASEQITFDIATNFKFLPTDPPPELHYTVGKVFTQAEIDAALRANDETFPSKDRLGHGTHCLGIAAGDGSQAGASDKEFCCHHAGYYIGVAPDADLVVVKTTLQSDDWVRGARHTFDQAWRPAGAPFKPAVVSMSFGAQGSAHDGTDPAEVALDALVAARPGRAIVAAAGNDGKLVDFSKRPHDQFGGGIHSAKKVLAGKPMTFRFTVEEGDRDPDGFQIWYGGAGRLNFRLTTPDNQPSATIVPVPDTTDPTKPDPTQKFTLAGHAVRVQSVLNRAQNNKHRIVLDIAPPAGGTIAVGTWTITLTETAGTDTPVDCWIQPQATDAHARWITPDQRRESTVEMPASAKNVIAVGAYDPSNGQLGDFSGRGPTLDGEGRIKPDITAPGVGIVAPKNLARDSCWRPDCCVNFYTPEDGTSSAAPHVAGTVALMFEANPNLTFADVFTNLTSTARRPDPDPTPNKPNNDWGYGKVDAEAAVRKSLPATPGAPPAPAAAAVTARADTYRPTAERLEALRERVLASPTGRLLFALVSEHVDEVRRLVNTDRRSLVAWHRMHGPGLLRGLLGRYDDEVPIPAEHDGRPVPDGLGRLLDALAGAGSPALREAIDTHRALLLAVPGASLADLDLLEVH